MLLGLTRVRRRRRLGDPGPLSRVPARRSGPAAGRGRAPQRRGCSLARSTARARRAVASAILEVAFGGTARGPRRSGPRLPTRAAARGGDRLSRCRPRCGADHRAGRGTRRATDRHARSGGAVVVASATSRLRWSAGDPARHDRLGPARGVQPAVGRGADRRRSGPSAATPGTYRRGDRGVGRAGLRAGTDRGRRCHRGREAARAPIGRSGRGDGRRRARSAPCRPAASPWDAGTGARSRPSPSLATLARSTRPNRAA